MKVCIDASLVLKLFINEPLSEDISNLWESWVLERVERIAPSFFSIEIISALRKLGKRGLINPDIEKSAVEIFVREFLPTIRIYDVNSELLRRAWEISKELDFMHVYDAIYIVLAEREGCTFWTADSKLYKACKREFPFLRFIT
ncbi:MAG: type II toxin-antitoxin system VapC family toxin [bacterium]|nr:type II toxin-antitoxin system VapC family toxin [bacterium]MDW8034659.1 type II toxin-antitoxin system VapC family toxin [Nitrososphaerota archaeon]